MVGELESNRILRLSEGYADQALPNSLIEMVSTGIVFRILGSWLNALEIGHVCQKLNMMA